MDEDELLLDSTASDHKEADLNDLDEDALLGDDTYSEAAAAAIRETRTSSEILKDESFELDYDEDEEKEERSGKFTSERSTESGNNLNSSTTSQSCSNENAGSGSREAPKFIKYPYNPRGRGQAPGQPMNMNNFHGRGGIGGFRGRAGYNNFQSGPPRMGPPGPGIQPTMVFNLVQGSLATNPFGPGGIPLNLNPNIPPIGGPVSLMGGPLGPVGGIGPGGPMIRPMGPGPVSGPPLQRGAGPSKSLPSLLNMEVPEPSVIPGRPQKILINPNFKPTGPSGPPGNIPPVMITGAPPTLMGGPGGPPMNGPIGMRPIGMMPGMPGAGAPMMSGPGMPPLIGGPMGMTQGMQVGGQWDNAVAAFLGKTTATTRKRSRSRRSSSYSSYSSYTSRSRSSSYSSRSRSRSRDRDRPARIRYDGGRKRGRGDRNGRGTRGRGGQRREYHERDNRQNTRRDDKPRRDPKEDTMESAKALGLDADYLKKLDEQKKQREEINRRKYGSKNESSDSKRESHRDSRRRDDSRDRRKDRNQKKDSERNGRDSQSQKDTDKEGKNDSQSSKKKAYLAVRVGNIQHLPSALKKVRDAAEEVGELRKCWQSDQDVVSVIFIEHDKAKNFMIKYNTKVWSGVRITVNLEKIYLNLAEIP